MLTINFQIKKIVVNPTNLKDRTFFAMEGMQPMMTQHIFDDEERSYEWLQRTSIRQV